MSIFTWRDEPPVQYVKREKRRNSTFDTLLVGRRGNYIHLGHTSKEDEIKVLKLVSLFPCRRVKDEIDFLVLSFNGKDIHFKTIRLLAVPLFSENKITPDTWDWFISRI